MVTTLISSLFFHLVIICQCFLYLEEGGAGGGRGGDCGSRKYLQI